MPASERGGASRRQSDRKGRSRKVAAAKKEAEPVTEPSDENGERGRTPDADEPPVASAFF